MSSSNPQPDLQQILSQVQLQKHELLLDGFRRLESHSPVMMLPRLIMTQHLHKMLRAARERLADSHRYQQHLLGEETMSDDPGGISVQGDTNVFQLAPAGGFLRALGKAAATAAAIVCFVICAAALVATPAKHTTPAVVAPPAASDVSDWRLGLQVTDKP